jgi:hypothetical protein
MSYEEHSYFERRAEEELAHAQLASHHAAVRAHYELASAYLDRIHGDTPRSSGGLFGN